MASCTHLWLFLVLSIFFAKSLVSELSASGRFERLSTYVGKRLASVNGSKSVQTSTISLCSHMCTLQFGNSCSFFSFDVDSESCEFSDSPWDDSYASDAGSSCSIFHRVQTFHLRLNGADNHYKYRVSLHGDARYASVDGSTALYLDGSSDYATVSPVPKISRTSYTLGLSFRLATNGEVTLFGDWTEPWQFWLRTSSDKKLCVTVRKSAVSTTSNMIDACTSSTVTSNKWYDVAFSKDFATGDWYLYVNSDVLSNGNVGSRVLQQENDHSSWEIGYKGDNQNSFTHGYIRNLFVVKEVLSIAQIEEYLPSPPETPAVLVLELDGAGTSNPQYQYSVSLSGDATYTTIDGWTALYLDGSGDLVSFSPPPVITHTSYTMGASIRLTNLNVYQIILGDWTSPWQFMFKINTDNTLGINVRNNVYPSTSDLIAASTTSTVQLDTWHRVAFSRDFASGAWSLHLDSDATTGTIAGNTAQQENTHTTWELGWKGDGHDSVLNGYIRKVFVVDRVLSVGEINEMLPMPV